MRLIKPLLIFFIIFLSLESCTKNENHLDQISWNDNSLTYHLSHETATIGEMVFLEVDAKLQPFTTFEIVLSDGSPLQKHFLNSYFTDSTQTKWIGELIWLTEGEQVVDYCSVIFHSAEQVSAPLKLSSLVIEMTSVLEISSKEIQQQIEEFIKQIKLPLLIPIQIRYFVLIGFASLFIIILVIFVIILWVHKYRKKNDFIPISFQEQQKKLLQLYIKDRDNKDALLALYNLLLKSIQFLKEKDKNINTAYYTVLSQYLEDRLFSKQIIQLKDSQKERVQFIESYKNWMIEADKVQREGELNATI